MLKGGAWPPSVPPAECEFIIQLMSCVQALCCHHVSKTAWDACAQGAASLSWFLKSSSMVTASQKCNTCVQTLHTPQKHNSLRHVTLVTFLTVGKDHLYLFHSAIKCTDLRSESLCDVSQAVEGLCLKITSWDVLQKHQLSNQTS